MYKGKQPKMRYNGLFLSYKKRTGNQCVNLSLKLKKNCRCSTVCVREREGERKWRGQLFLFFKVFQLKS